MDHNAVKKWYEELKECTRYRSVQLYASGKPTIPDQPDTTGSLEMEIKMRSKLD